MSNYMNNEEMKRLGEKIHELRELKKITRKIGDNLSPKKNEEPLTYRLVDVGDGIKLRLRDEEYPLNRSNSSQRKIKK